MSLTSQYLLNYYELQRPITYNIINMTIVYINNSQHVSVKRTVTHKTKTGPKY